MDAAALELTCGFRLSKVIISYSIFSFKKPIPRFHVSYILLYSSTVCDKHAQFMIINYSVS